MDGDEQVGAQFARDAIAFLQNQIFVIVAGQRDAHPARFDELVADCLRDRQRHILFALAHVGVDRTRIMAAMASVDHHQRPRPIARPFD